MHLTFLGYAFFAASLWSLFEITKSDLNIEKGMMFLVLGVVVHCTNEIIKAIKGK